MKKKILTRFSDFITEGVNYGSLLTKNKDNKFHIAIEYDKKYIDILQSYNVPFENDIKGDWIVFNFLEKYYKIYSNDECTFEVGDDNIEYITIKTIKDSAYRIIDEQILKSYMRGL